jgi:hypothetical protein
MTADLIREAVREFEEERTDESFSDLYTVINQESSFRDLDEKLFALCFERYTLDEGDWREVYKDLLDTHLDRFETYFTEEESFEEFKERFSSRHQQEIEKAFDALQNELVNSVSFEDIVP